MLSSCCDVDQSHGLTECHFLCHQCSTLGSGESLAVPQLPVCAQAWWHFLAPLLCMLQYAWVKKHFGSAFLEQIVLTRDKTVVSADLLIDDRPDITGKWPAAGKG